MGIFALWVRILLIISYGLVYPSCTSVGMTSVLVHHDESVFPNSRLFLPERWINHPRLDKYLLSFSKGTRQCVGINLAFAEIYLVLASVFRALGSVDVRELGDVGFIGLFETTKDDVEVTGRTMSLHETVHRASTDSTETGLALDTATTSCSHQHYKSSSKWH
jgi:hypothetical protein